MPKKKQTARRIRSLRPGDVFRFKDFESIADQRVTFRVSLEEEYIVHDHVAARRLYEYDRLRPWMTTSRKCIETYIFRKTDAATRIPPDRNAMGVHYTDYDGELRGEPPYRSIVTGQDSLASERGRRPKFRDTLVNVVGHMEEVDGVMVEQSKPRA